MRGMLHDACCLPSRKWYWLISLSTHDARRNVSSLLKLIITTPVSHLVAYIGSCGGTGSESEVLLRILKSHVFTVASKEDVEKTFGERLLKREMLMKFPWIFLNSCTTWAVAKSYTIASWEYPETRSLSVEQFLHKSIKALSIESCCTTRFFMWRHGYLQVDARQLVEARKFWNFTVTIRDAVIPHYTAI